MDNIYSNGYMSEHSNCLNGRFMISNRGVDYYNLNNVSFEFKESFIKDRDNVFFVVPKKQLEESMFILFNDNNEEYYIVRSFELLMRYSFKSSLKRCCPGINAIKEICCYETYNLDDLEDFMDNLTIDDV